MKYTVTVGGRTVAVDVRGGDVTVDNRPVRAELTAVPHTPLRHLTLDGRSHVYAMTRSDGAWTVVSGGEHLTVEVVDERTAMLREMTGRTASHGAGGTVKAPMPGLVLRVEVALGQAVAAGAGLVVLEAMKMENEIKAPGAGVVSAIHVAAGQPVEKGAVLVELGDAAEPQ